MYSDRQNHGVIDYNHPLFNAHWTYIQAVIEFYDYFCQNYRYLIGGNIFIVIMIVNFSQNLFVILDYHIFSDKILTAWVSCILSVSMCIIYLLYLKRMWKRMMII